MVSRSLTEVTEALNHPDIMLRFIRFPLARQEREAVILRNEFLGMPRVLGFVDGTLIKIVPPNGPQKRVYRSRKGFPAINAQIVCNADLYIMNVNARFPGSSNDPYIYRESGVRQAAMECYNENPCWLLGDSIYPHEPSLMRPLPLPERGTPEYSYNKLHCHCRNAVERCIGVLKGRWRCFLSDRTLHYQPTKAGRIINACVALHNFLIMKKVPLPAPEMEDFGEDVPDALLEEDLPFH